MNQDTGPSASGPHFAGLVFPSAFVDEIALYVPTLEQAAVASGIARFKFQALVGGTWTNLAPTSVSGAVPSAPGWFSTTTPVTHQIVAHLGEPRPAASPKGSAAGLICEGVRVLMDAGGGSAAHPNRLSVNEIEVFATTPGQRIENRLIKYDHDDQGNMETRTIHAGPTAADPVETREIFSVDYMNRIDGYLRQSGGGTTQAQHAYLFAPTGQRLCASNSLAATSEWYMSDGDDVVADYLSSVALATSPSG
jgi:hypothetical protein